MRAMTAYDLLPLPQYCCRECGSPDIQIQVWVMANTEEVQDDAGSYNWCNNCEETIGDGEQKYIAQVTGVNAAGELEWKEF